LISLGAVALACRATEPAGRSDPTTLVTNHALDSAVVTFTWSDGRTQAATLQAGGFACVIYVVLADSGRFTVSIPTPSGVNAGHSAVMLGPSTWFAVDSTAGAYSFKSAALAGPDLALLITEDGSGTYGYAIGSAQRCAP
jgi:hypothetical protein